MSEQLELFMAPAVTGPVVVYVHNPLDVSSREVIRADPYKSLNELRPSTDLPTICVLNGEPVLPDDWVYVPRSGDHVVFMTLPKGGGGGSNPLSVVLAIVVIVAGVVTENPYLIAAGAAMLATGLLPLPTFTPISTPGAIAEPSPTYSIQLQANSARLGQAIPVPYGYHIMMPDFAAQPYSEFDGAGDQYYHALFCLGMMSHFDIVNTLIDDTPLAHFVGVETQLYGPQYTTPITLVNSAVVNAPEVAQQDLLYGTIVGPFAACGPGLQCTELGIDVVCPKGLYYATDSGTLDPKTVDWMVEARALTDTGAIAGVWFLLGMETLTDATNTPVRRSYKYTVPAGRYQVRMQRTSPRDDNTRAGHDIQWWGMRAYLDIEADLDPAATYMALRIKANNQLSGLSQRKISIIYQRWLPTWNPDTGWSDPVPTSSIAWALADALRNTDYGGQIEDSRIDLQTLYDLDQLWASRQDQFNGIFDKRITLWNALATIARVGRARPLMRGGVFTFVRDSQQDLPVALFNMRNIDRGSFSIDYAMWTDDSADGIELEFFDQATWSSNYVTLPLPGASGDPINPARMSMIGVSYLRQAQREAAYYVAEAAYRRATISFTTELEGHLPSYGDLIAISHDIAGWGSSGEIIEWTGTEALCSEELIFGIGTNYAMLVNQQGDPSGPYKVQEGSRLNSMKFIEIPDFVPYTGVEYERTRYAMGPSSEYAKMARVVSITPSTGNKVEIRALLEDNRVHEADVPYTGGPGAGPGAAVRRGHYTPDDIPVYDASSDDQRNLYGYFSTEEGTVGSTPDEGYTYDN